MAIYAVANGNVSSQNDVNQFKSLLIDGTMNDQAINLVYTGASNALKISSSSTFGALTVTNPGVAKDVFNVNPMSLIVSVPNGGKLDCYSDAYTTVTASIDASTGRMNLASVLSALGVYDQTEQWRIEVGQVTPTLGTVPSLGTWSAAQTFAHAFNAAPIVLVSLGSPSNTTAPFTIMAESVTSSQFTWVLQNWTTGTPQAAQYLVNYLAFGY